MHILINLDQFRTAFATHHAGQYANQFTYEGLGYLFNYLEELEDELSHDCNPIELDVIAFCCEYAEYNLTELPSILGVELDEDMDEQGLLDLLETKTIVIGKTPTTVVVHQF